MNELKTEKSLWGKLPALFVVIGILVLSGCSKDEPLTKDQSSAKDKEIPNLSKEDFLRQQYEYLGQETLFELQQARASTAKYRQIKNAVKDGYEDINVVIPQMGFHFMKSTLVDTTFDYRNPEILVYNMDSDSNYKLVAVEYAVPIALSPEAPEGFTGPYDVWTANEEIGLWLLHAWVWYYNPDGIFDPTNPNIYLP